MTSLRAARLAFTQGFTDFGGDEDIRIKDLIQREETIIDSHRPEEDDREVYRMVSRLMRRKAHAK